VIWEAGLTNGVLQEKGLIKGIGSLKSAAY